MSFNLINILTMMLCSPIFKTVPFMSIRSLMKREISQDHFSVRLSYENLITDAAYQSLFHFEAVKAAKLVDIKFLALLRLRSRSNKNIVYDCSLLCFNNIAILHTISTK